MGISLFLSEDDVRKFLSSEGIAKTSAIALAILIIVAVGIGAWVVTRPPVPERRIVVIGSLVGRGDLSFNDMAFKGGDWVAAELGMKHVELVAPTIPDFLPAGRVAAGDPLAEIIVFVGFLAGEALATVAMEFPEKNFIGIETGAQWWVRDHPDPAIAARFPLPNVLDVFFEQHRSSALAGALAGLLAAYYHKPHVGVVFGMEIPVLWNFEIGYKWGVDYAMSWIENNMPGMMRGIYHTPRKDRVLWHYTTSFVDPALGHVTAMPMYEKDAAAVFNVAGATGLGIKSALEDFIEDKGLEMGPPFWVGCDASQDWMLPGFTIASAMKRVDRGVFYPARLHIEGRFREAVENHGGIVTIGLGTKILDIPVEGVGMSTMADLDDFIEFGIRAAEILGVPVLPMPPEEIRTRVQAMRDAQPDWIWNMVADLEENIRAGIVEVPNVWTGPDRDFWRAILG